MRSLKTGHEWSFKPPPDQAREYAALDKMRRIDGPETSTIFCKCGHSYSWCGVDDGLRLFLAMHADHMLGRAEAQP